MNWTGLRSSIAAIAPLNRIVSQDGAKNEEEELCQIALDLAGYPQEENFWYYSICYLLGNLSAQVFPATPDEHQQWKAKYRSWQGWYDREQIRTHDA